MTLDGWIEELRYGDLDSIKAGGGRRQMVMRDWKPNKTMTEIEYIEWIIDLFFANKRAYKRRANNEN